MPKVIMGTIAGDKELTAALGRYPMFLRKDVLRPAMRVSAKFLAAEIKKRTPRDTGRLVRSFKVRAVKRSRTQFGSRIVTGRELFGGEQFYGAFQELGYRSRGGRKIPGRRFMRAALEENRREAQALVAREARQRFPKSIAKARSKGKI